MAFKGDLLIHLSTDATEAIAEMSDSLGISPNALAKNLLNSFFGGINQLKVTGEYTDTSYPSDRAIPTADKYVPDMREDTVSDPPSNEADLTPDLIRESIPVEEVDDQSQVPGIYRDEDTLWAYPYGRGTRG